MPTLYEDARSFVSKCEMPGDRKLDKKTNEAFAPTTEIKLFDVWEVSLIGPFPKSQNNYIMIDVDYVSQWRKSWCFQTKML